MERKRDAVAELSANGARRTINKNAQIKEHYKLKDLGEIEEDEEDPFFTLEMELSYKKDDIKEHQRKKAERSESQTVSLSEVE